MHAERTSAIRKPLRRLRDRSGRTLSYRHPHGYRIVRTVRDWDWERGSAGWTPKVMWEVRRGGQTGSLGRGFMGAFTTLRAAREWCDENPRRHG